MLNKTASSVLASPRGSMYRSVRLASSLATALLNGLFEYPIDILFYYAARLSSAQAHARTTYVLACPHSFSAAC